MKAILKAERGTKNIAKIWKLICEEYGDSVTTSMTALEQKRFLVTNNFSTTRWKGTSVSMIDYFMEIFRRYNVTNPGNEISDEDMIEYLRMAAIGHKKFEPVWTTYEIQRKTDGSKSPIRLSTYVALLKTAAQQLDASNDNRGGGRRFQANLHSIGEEDDEMDERQYEAHIHEMDDGESFDIDTPIAEIEAFQMMQRPGNGSTSKTTSARLPNDVFFGLSQEGKKAWVTLSQADKLQILSGVSGKTKSATTNGTSKTTPPRDSKGKFQRSANEHSQEPGNKEDDGSDSEEDETTEDSKTVESHSHEIHKTESKPAHEETRVLDLMRQNSTAPKGFGPTQSYLSDIVKKNAKGTKHEVQQESYIADRQLSVDTLGLSANVHEKHVRKAPTAVRVLPADEYSGTIQVEALYGNEWKNADEWLDCKIVPNCEMERKVDLADCELAGN